MPQDVRFDWLLKCLSVSFKYSSYDRLKAYRRAKVLWIGCGERWAKDCQCKATVQLHVVQEMAELSRSTAAGYSMLQDHDDSASDLRVLSAEANQKSPALRSIQLACSVVLNLAVTLFSWSTRAALIPF